MSTYTSLALTGQAAEENAGAINHKFMLNDDGQAVMAVAYLLDRRTYRPAINQENRFGQTALMRACSVGRPYTVQALLDRGADINYLNKFGRTALHFAATVGNTDCIRICLERGVDTTLRDVNGKNAYDVAYDLGFSMVLTQMSRFAGGNLGPVAISRGNVIDLIGCPNGCGKSMYPHDVKVREGVKLLDRWY